MDEKRIYFYDLIKVIAIYFVCLYHFGTLGSDFVRPTHNAANLPYFLEALTSIGVPLFFMVNGALLLNKGYNLKQHLYKTALLIGLYLAWGAITLIIIAPKFGEKYSVAGFIESVYYTQDGRTNHLWFLTALVYIYLLFPVIKAVYDSSQQILKRYTIGLIFIFAFGSVLLSNLMNVSGYLLHSNTLQTKQLEIFPWSNPFSFPYAYSLIYFIAGGFLVKVNGYRNVKSGNCVLVFLCCWVMLFLLGIVKTNITSEHYDPVYNGYNTVMTLGMSICFFILCSRIRFHNKKFKEIIALLSLNTLGIYFIHVPVGFWLKDFYEGSVFSKYLIADLFYALFIMLLAFGISLLLRKIPLVNRLVKI